MKTYQIKPLTWTKENAILVAKGINRTYCIRQDGELYQVYYGGRQPKECKDILSAMTWCEEVHHPAMLAEFISPITWHDYSDVSPSLSGQYMVEYHLPNVCSRVPKIAVVDYDTLTKSFVLYNSYISRWCEIS